jgi:hypothetical protein
MHMGGSGDDPVHVKNNGIELLRGDNTAIEIHVFLPDVREMIFLNTIRFS